MDGQPTGSVRVSFGYMSTFEDCQRFLNFVAECFVEKPVTLDDGRLQKLRAATTGRQEESGRRPTNRVINGGIKSVSEEKPVPVDQSKTGGSGRSVPQSPGGAYVLTNIYIYPIKSCGSFEV